MENIPVLKVNGKQYEIRRNRFLIATFDELKRDIGFTQEQSSSFVKEQDRVNTLARLRDRKNELEGKYFETFDEKDKELYEKALNAYNRLVEEMSSETSALDDISKKTVDCGEKLVIKALQFDKSGKRVMEEDAAIAIWEQFVDENGQSVAEEFVSYTLIYISGTNEDTENPFVLKMREQRKMKK